MCMRVDALRCGAMPLTAVPVAAWCGLDDFSASSGLMHYIKVNSIHSNNSDKVLPNHPPINPELHDDAVKTICASQ